MYTIPKGISEHPGVCDADLDDDGYGTEDLPGGLRADVILKDGWHFAALDDNAEYNSWDMRRCGFFPTLKAFKEAKPTQYTAEEMASRPKEQETW